MNDELSGKVKEIFLAAIELDSVDQREAFLAQVCKSDSAPAQQN